VPEGVGVRSGNPEREAVSCQVALGVLSAVDVFMESRGAPRWRQAASGHSGRSADQSVPLCLSREMPLVVPLDGCPYPRYHCITDWIVWELALGRGMAADESRVACA
jgi:hypothetical protein